MGSSEEDAAFDFLTDPETIRGPMTDKEYVFHAVEVLKLAREIDWPGMDNAEICHVIGEYLSYSNWDPKIHLVLAFHGDSVVGFAFVSGIRERRQRWKLHFVGVAESHQRNGTGDRLVMALHNYLRTKGLEGFIAEVNNRNPNALRFFEAVSRKHDVSMECIEIDGPLHTLYFPV